ncbi:protein DCL [Pyrus ussuriensis x Pyrus communis]|uniref:Protein DCL n=1 Tax=Pyrus ussuriensis x Pyrus communis TaxID=2448454 RepID=A0A5N5H2F9_9ROSA|nr:protein DCL [Pyrus ussuriensis x Pyrus communis]
MSWPDDMYGVARNFRGVASVVRVVPTRVLRCFLHAQPLSKDLSAEDNGLFGRVDSLTSLHYALSLGTVSLRPKRRWWTRRQRNEIVRSSNRFLQIRGGGCEGSIV